MVQTAQAPVALSPLLGETDPANSLTLIKDKQGVEKSTPFILARRTARARMATCTHIQDAAVTSLPLHLGGTVFVHKKDEGCNSLGLPFIYFKSKLELSFVVFSYKTQSALSISLFCCCTCFLNSSEGWFNKWLLFIPKIHT